MPRVKPLIEDADAERKKATRTIIEVAMKIQGFRNYAEIARRIDLDPSCFGQRLRNCRRKKAAKRCNRLLVLLDARWLQSERRASVIFDGSAAQSSRRNPDTSVCRSNARQLTITGLLY